MAKETKLVRELVEEVMTAVEGWLEEKMPDVEDGGQAAVVGAALSVCLAGAAKAAGLDRARFLASCASAFDEMGD